MRPPGTPKQLEKRRRRAVQLLKSGQSLPMVARHVGAAVSSVFRWWQAYRRKGTRGLDAKPTPGRPPRLSPTEKRQLVKTLTRGAQRAGYRTDLWTLPRVTEVIRQQFGVRYHTAHVWKVLTAVGWSCQKPERRAVERDEVASARWMQQDWPRIKKRRAPRRPSRVRR